MEKDQLLYKGEMFILLAEEENGIVHVRNRDCCLGHTNNFVVAWNIMRQVNWQIVHRAGLKFPPPKTQIEKVLIQQVLTAMEKQFKAWLN